MLIIKYTKFFRQRHLLTCLNAFGVHQTKALCSESQAFLMSKLWLKEANQIDLKEEQRKHENCLYEEHFLETDTKYSYTSNKNYNENKLISTITLIHQHLQDSDGNYRKSNLHSISTVETIVDKQHEDKYSYLDSIIRDILYLSLERQIDIENDRIF